MSLFAASKAAVGANPNISQLLASTTNKNPASPPVAVGLVLRGTPTGTPLVPAQVPKGGKAYLTVSLNVDFRGDDIMLAGDLEKLQVTSWTSNGIRDQNLLSETGITAEAFAFNTLRRFGFDVAPTAATQTIVIEVTNIDAANVANCRGIIAGTCGDCNVQGGA